MSTVPDISGGTKTTEPSGTSSTTGTSGSSEASARPKDLMARTLHRLQREYALEGSQPTPWAAATMAALRTAGPGQVDAHPATWPVLYGTFPQGYGYGQEEVSSRERAAHATLVLYAVHQASQPKGMYVPGISLGRALGRLPDAKEAKSPVLRRFTSLISATTFESTMQHLRGLVTLLRREHLPVDYVSLYADLIGLQDAKQAPAVRRRWGRDYFGSRTPEREKAAAARPDAAPSDSTAGATGNTNGSGGLGADQHSTSTTFDLQH
ncbi:MAG: type I-E CRISPR-associated protein Cse2/CasB [Austwickia sp.]|nr:type I-E CRISPR-associated protein Cse2/CasB [Actinomycetota bacterium]MCB1254517.1 type I-E CRISPR-associated protein Cse2/CasB [Austwickia sp.]MCO5309617.1 type I-E CRISPR-associated protein Cse2/CasB [Austwickia sp.]